MDATARDLLSEARDHYARLGFRTNSIIGFRDARFAVATRAGTIKTATLALALRSFGFEVEAFDGLLSVTLNEDGQDLRGTIHRLALGQITKLFSDQTNLLFEKFHPYLARDLLELDALSSKVDTAALAGLCERIQRSVIRMTGNADQ